MKMHGVKSANLLQSPMGNDVLELWYCYLGHLNVKNVHTLQNMVSNMNLGIFSCPTSLFLCETCKQYRVAFSNKGGRQATKPLEIVHFDVFGPMRTTSKVFCNLP